MVTFYQSPVGLIRIEEQDNCITSVALVDKSEKPAQAPTPLLQKAITQLEEYFAGKRKVFDLPLKQQGTEFQKKAWEYLSTIPYGKTVSYKDEAVFIGSPKGCRAVGSANGRNNIAIIVPCHRVVNAGGKLGGYAYGLDVKRYLLDLEAKYVE